MYLTDGHITLRAIERADNGVLKELVNDPGVERLIGGWSFPSSDEKQYQWYDALISDDAGHHVRFAVDAGSGCIGMAALGGIDYKNSNAGIDIKLLASSRGSGIGTGAIRLLVTYAFEELNLHCVTALVLEENAASRKAFEKAGFALDGILRNRIYKGGRYHSQCAYSVIRN